MENIKEEIKKNIKRGDCQKKGGQQAGIKSDVLLLSEELNIEIRVGFHRSHHKNVELAYTLLELAIDDLLK